MPPRDGRGGGLGELQGPRKRERGASSDCESQPVVFAAVSHSVWREGDAGAGAHKGVWRVGVGPTHGVVWGGACHVRGRWVGGRPTPTPPRGWWPLGNARIGAVCSVVEALNVCSD